MGNFLRTLFFFPLFWAHQLTILPKMFRYKRRMEAAQSTLDRANVWHAASSVSSDWGARVVKWGGACVEVVDQARLSPEQAVLYVSNHQGAFDIPLLLAFTDRNIGFVAKKELGNIPLVSDWMRLIGCIFLDRDDRRKQIQQIRDTVDALQAGYSMVVFPEGTRSNSPSMAPFAKGSLNIAAKAGVPIVPVTLKDSYKLKGQKKGLPGGDVKIVFHPAVLPSDLTKEEASVLHETVQATIASAL